MAVEGLVLAAVPPRGPTGDALVSLRHAGLDALPPGAVVATVGVLLLARGRLVPWLLPIPMLWCLLSGMTLQTMGEPQAFAPYAVLVLAAIASIWRLVSRPR